VLGLLAALLGLASIIVLIMVAEAWAIQTFGDEPVDVPDHVKRLMSFAEDSEGVVNPI